VSEFVKRALTGAVYVALTLGAAVAGQLTTLLLFLPVCLLAAREMHRLQWGDEGPAVERSMLLTGLFYLATALSALLPWMTTMVVAAVALGLLAVVAMAALRNGTSPAQEVGGGLIMLCYIALPFGLIPHLLQDGPHCFIGFMLLLWTNDTGAYLVGRAIGRTPLMPTVSPKKTVEGLLGGIALAVLVAWGLALYRHELTLLQWLVCALVVAVMSTLGDLLESAFKRAAGVKDSGRVLPGHGGILDRFDGFLLAAPAMLVCVHLLR
jgi:phosphatidate cytidylyltransferase